MEDALELLLEPIMRHIATQRALGNNPDGLLMSADTLKKLSERIDGEPNKLDDIGVPITITDELPYGRIGISIEVPEGNLKKTLEDLKDGI